MTCTIGRISLAAGFSLSTWLCLVTPGCASAPHEFDFAPITSEESTQAPERLIAATTVQQMEQCTRDGAGRLTTYSHSIQFDIEVTPQGDVTRVKLRDSTLNDSAIESCMMRAIAAMSLPVDALPLRSTEPFSGGEWMRHSREPLGVAQALGGLVALGPIIIVAAGVTLGVYVGAVVVDEAIEAAKRKNKNEAWCASLRDECLGNSWQPEWNRERFGEKKNCMGCYWSCQRHRKWDDDKCPRSN